MARASTRQNIWVCLASGPSLSDEDVEHARAAGARIAVCSDNWSKAPDCEIVYAADYGWWQHYYTEVKQHTRARLYCSSSVAAARYGLNCVRTYKEPGWSTTPGRAHSCYLSGCVPPQIVTWEEQPDLLILLGYDMQHTDGKAHWFGDHPEPFKLNCPEPEKKLPWFDRMAKFAPCRVINCTRETTLTCFPRARIDEVLNAHS